jgi:hypothetical protein
MTQMTKAKKFWLGLMVATLVLAALPSTAAAAEEDLVRFRVENRADRSITIRLYAQDGTGRAYYMQVEALTTKSMSPIRGRYDYRLTACGVMVTGTVNLTKPLTWIMPRCGDKGGAGTKAANTQDIGREILKLNKVILVNKTAQDVRIWLAGRYPYTFLLPAGGHTTVSLLKGSYTWSGTFCGSQQTGNLFVNNTTKKVFECK